MANTIDYQRLNAELDDILDKLQNPDIAVDEAISLYEQGLKVAATLERHLQQAENKLTKLKVRQPGDV